MSKGTSKLDHISSALEYFDRILSLYKCLEEKRKDAKKFARSFNTRARNGPQLIKDQGIIPYLTFLASKSGEDLVRDLYKILKSEKAQCDKIESLDKAGYAAYFNAITMYLEKLGILKITESTSVIEIARMLFENLQSYRIIEPVLMNYLAELKKLSNAYFKEVE